MNRKVLLLLWLLPYTVPFIISIGAVFGIIPLSPGTSPRIPIISAFAFGFLLCFMIWKWRSPENQATLSGLNTTRKVEKSRVHRLILVQSLMIILFTILGVGAGVFSLSAGQIESSGELLVALGMLAALLSIAAFFYAKKVQNMATKSGPDGLPQDGNGDSERT